MLVALMNRCGFEACANPSVKTESIETLGTVQSFSIVKLNKALQMLFLRRHKTTIKI